MAAQLIPRDGLQLYSLEVGPLPTQGPTTLYTRRRGPQYKNSLTSSAVESLAIVDVETGLKLREHWGGQLLGEDVNELRSRWDVEDMNVPDGNTLADKVKINLNMLGALVLNGVSGEVDVGDVVAVDQSGHNVVLRLSARTGDDVLTLRGPRDEVIAHEHRVAWSGRMSVGTTGPVSISVDDEVQCRGTVKKQAVVEGALEVLKDVFRGRKMGLTAVMHVEAHLLDRVGNVGPGVTDRPPHVGGDLGLSVDRRGAGLAVAHASTLKNVSSILALVEEETVRPLLYWDAEEVVERAEVHRELLLKSCSGMLEKLHARGGEDDVVDVE
jgi:hypothetical protein